MIEPEPVRTVWRKSSRSGPQGGACVEIAAGEQVILARDSKLPNGAVLAFDHAAWSTFLGDVKRGSHDIRRRGQDLPGLP